MQDDLDQIVGHRAVQIAVERQRRPAAEQRRAADLVANRAGALIDPGAGGGRRQRSRAGRRLELGGAGLLRRSISSAVFFAIEFSTWVITKMAKAAVTRKLQSITSPFFVT